MVRCQVLAEVWLLHSVQQRNTWVAQIPIPLEVAAMGALRPEAAGRGRIRWVAGLMEAASCVCVGNQ